MNPGVAPGRAGARTHHALGRILERRKDRLTRERQGLVVLARELERDLAAWRDDQSAVEAERSRWRQGRAVQVGAARLLGSAQSGEVDRWLLQEMARLLVQRERALQARALQLRQAQDAWRRRHMAMQALERRLVDHAAQLRRAESRTLERRLEEDWRQVGPSRPDTGGVRPVIGNRASAQWLADGGAELRS